MNVQSLEQTLNLFSDCTKTSNQNYKPLLKLAHSMKRHEIHLLFLSRLHLIIAVTKVSYNDDLRSFWPERAY